MLLSGRPSDTGMRAPSRQIRFVHSKPDRASGYARSRSSTDAAWLAADTVSASHNQAAAQMLRRAFMVKTAGDEKRSPALYRLPEPVPSRKPMLPGPCLMLRMTLMLALALSACEATPAPGAEQAPPPGTARVRRRGRALAAVCAHSVQALHAGGCDRDRGAGVALVRATGERQSAAAR